MTAEAKQLADRVALVTGASRGIGHATALALANGYLYVGTDNGLVRVQEQKLHP